MVQVYEDRRMGSFLGMSTDFFTDRPHFDHISNLLYIHWNRGTAPADISIGYVTIRLQPGQLISNTYLQPCRIISKEQPLTTFAFNREFYCIADHDHEVSCNGILFMGAQTPPVISPDQEETRKLELLLAVFEDEFTTRDDIQDEMLRMLLKRLIIKLTRQARSQQMPQVEDRQTIDIIRKFNVLVDQHFRDKHQVQDYAELLFRSPKTLSNLFAKSGLPSPLVTIHQRIALEARRLLLHSDLSVKQIAYELGFSDAGAFQRIFKKCTGQTAATFRKAHAPAA
jgi:AraC-like DNA-binding protein